MKKEEALELEKKGFVKANRELEKKHFEGLNKKSKFMFLLANDYTPISSNWIIQAISKSKVGFSLIGVFLSWIAGSALSSNIVFTIGCLFFFVFLMIVHYFENCDYDYLKQQYLELKSTKQKLDNQKWTFQKFKNRVKKYYSFIFLAFSVFSVFIFGLSDLEFNYKVAIGYLMLSMIATTILSTLIEYTIGGLHNNRKLNFTMIGLLVVYAFLNYFGNVYEMVMR